MLKRDEVRTPDSCLNRTQADEMVFVLCARDACAPHAIREWAKARVDSGLNKADDQKIKDALLTATIMEEQRAGGMFDILEKARIA